MSPWRILTLLCRLSSPRSKAMMASAGELNARPSPGSPSRSAVSQNRPMIMSCEGMVTGRPSDGLRMLLVESIRIRASAWASADSGRSTPIWSPAKSALNAPHTSGWIWMGLPSIICGSQTRVPRRERVDLDGFALDQLRLEGLDAETVEGGRPVEQHRVLHDDLFEDVPHHGVAAHARRRALDHPLGGLDVLRVGEVDEPLHHEGLEE